jgi:hypothetical protein
LTHGPIEPSRVAEMRVLARAIDELLNGDTKPKANGFVLLMFDMNSPDGRMNYISNANRDDMLCALKELIANFEGRMSSQEGHA